MPQDSNLIVGIESSDDAGVYKISDDLALIQTVDFFTPIVDDPYMFGQIAAANSFSDIYAMGGIPKTAMNIVCFPSKTMEISILRDVIRGGLDKIREAGVVLAGGHSIDDNELKYGLSVTGFVHPDKILRNNSINNNDLLILTKPIGTGIINTVIKGGFAKEHEIQYVTKTMSTLNKTASDIMKNFPVSACTDITGFGLAGHASEMIMGTGLGITFFECKIPLIEGVEEYASMGFVPGGTYNNKDFRSSIVNFSDNTGTYFSDLVFDPQTSGGLLISIDRHNADMLLNELTDHGIDRASIIGEVTDSHGENIFFK